MIYIGDLYTKTPAISHHDITFLACLGHLWLRDTDRIISIYIMMPKVAKVSTKMSLSHVIVIGIIVPLSLMLTPLSD
jgi:hypothetical protein